MLFPTPHPLFAGRVPPTVPPRRPTAARRPSARVVPLALLALLTGLAGSSAHAGRELGAPPIRIFNRPDHHGHSQTWHALQDRRGVMLFGNTNGILQFDGAAWQFLRIANRSIVRSLGMDAHGVVHYGAVGEIGYLRCDAAGKLTAVSLMDRLPPDTPTFSDVWSVIAAPSGVYFIATEVTLRWHQGRMTAIPLDGAFRSYLADDRVFVPHRTRGLLELVGDDVRPLPGGDRFRREQAGISVILPHPSGRLVLINRLGFCLYNLEPTDGGQPGEVEIPPTELADYLTGQTSPAYSGCLLPGGRYAIGTLGAGVVVVDPAGRIERVIDKRLGLSEDLVGGVLLDRQGNLWATTNNGISLIEWDSPVSLFDARNGLPYSAIHITRHDGQVLVGGFRGLQRLVWDAAGHRAGLEFLPDTPPTEGWCFLPLENTLLAGMGDGLYHVSRDGVRLLARSPTIYSLGHSPRHPETIFLGLMGGLSQLTVTLTPAPDGHAAPRLTAGPVTPVTGVPGPVRRMAVDRAGTLWVSSEFNGIYRLAVTAEPTGPPTIRAVPHGVAEGLPGLLHNYVFADGDDLLATTPEGIRRLHPPPADDPGARGRFVATPDIDRLLPAGFQAPTQFRRDQAGHIWLASENQLAVVRPGPAGPTAHILINGEIEQLYLDPAGIVWVGANQGLARIDIDRVTDPPASFRVLIRDLLAGKERIRFRGLFPSHHPARVSSQDLANLPEWPVLPYARNSLTFEFAAPWSQADGGNEYRYQLDGFRPDWTDWATDRRAVYTNLPEGRYTFRVQGRDVHGAISEVTALPVTIRPPYYRTVWAYSLYAILFAGSLYGGIRFNTRRLKRANLRLEALVQERTLTVTRQAEELRKLTIVASETDNAVIIMEADGRFEWVNKGFQRMYGLTLEELVRQQGATLTESSSNPDIAALLDTCIAEKRSVVYETSVLTPAGATRWSQTTLTPILDPTGDVHKLVAIDSDITERKVAEQRIRHQQTELEQYNRMLSQANRDLEQVNRKLADLATTDGMTGIANHRRFQEGLTSEWKRASRHGRPLTLILLDVDYFKRFNDRYGHQAGDDCLRRVAEALSASARRSNDLVARYGGEEFAVLLPETGANGAAVVAERVRAAVEGLAIPHQDSGAGRVVTVSLGVAILEPGAPLEPDALVRKADEALYAAKQAGRNRLAITRCPGPDPDAG